MTITRITIEWKENYDTGYFEGEAYEENRLIGTATGNTLFGVFDNLMGMVIELEEDARDH